MRALSASEQLRVWERGRRQTSARRCLILLAAASPESSPDELARLSVGQRDARLLTLREWMFGARIESVVACPECAERLELVFDAADIRAKSEAENAAPGATYLLRLDGYEVRFRPPNSSDLEAVAECRADAARDQLLARCALETKRGGAKKRGANQLPLKLANALVERMAQIDPQANVQLSLTCPACRNAWSATFDIASFLWSEIENWAPRVLREIHVIAFAYGWREADILEMSAERRSCYLEMIGKA
jgi:hypothetical protein